MPFRVVNCAALNDRSACNAHEAAAAAVNVPARLLDALDQHIKVNQRVAQLLVTLAWQAMGGQLALQQCAACCGPE